MAKTHDEAIEWLESQMRTLNINRAELARRGDITQGALSNVFSGKKGIGKRLAQKIALGLNMPQAIAFRGLGIADDDEQETTKTGQYIADLLSEIEDDAERENTLVIVTTIIRQVAEKVRSRGSPSQAKRANITARR